LLLHARWVYCRAPSSILTKRRKADSKNLLHKRSVFTVSNSTEPHSLLIRRFTFSSDDCLYSPRATVNQHPTSAPSTGWLLWLSFGWPSTELLPGFILVTHSIRSRSNI
jgi:hypothetical protein